MEKLFRLQGGEKNLPEIQCFLGFYPVPAAQIHLPSVVAASSSPAVMGENNNI